MKLYVFDPKKQLTLQILLQQQLHEKILPSSIRSYPDDSTWFATRKLLSQVPQSVEDSS